MNNTTINIVNDWNNLTDDEHMNWFYGDGVYGFIKHEMQKYNIKLDGYQITTLACHLTRENEYHKDCVERIKYSPASLLVAKNIVTKLTKEPGTYEQFQAEFYGDINAYCQQFIKNNNLEGVNVDAITEYVYDKLDEWDGFVF